MEKVIEPDYDRYIPSRAEILKMISIAECQRDRAMMFVLLESGARSGEFVRIRIKDAVFDKCGALIRVNGNTGERRIRLVESVLDLWLWLSMHPWRDDPDSPLWTIRKEPYKAITQGGLDTMIRKYCRVMKLGSIFGAHKFRHAQAKYGWTKNSEMPAVYVHHSLRDIDKIILEHYGIKIDDEKAMNPAMPKICPRCKNSNSAMARFCMQCSAPLDAKAVMEIEAKTAQADEITSQVLAEIVKRAPDLIANILSETGLQSRIVSVVKG